jgi:DNA-binding CsgD family transcriptional regulator
MKAELRTPIPGITAGDPLTDRELEILVAISRGGTNETIGQRMYLAADTIRTHVARMCRKLGADDRAHAVAIGFDLGLLKPAGRVAPWELECLALARQVLKGDDVWALRVQADRVLTRARIVGVDPQAVSS